MASTISLSNLLNLSNLEHVLNELFDKISTVSTRLDKLENSISSNVSLERFLSLKNDYESNMNLMEERIKYLEESVSSLKPIIEKCEYNHSQIDKLKEKSKSLVSIKHFTDSLNEMDTKISDEMQEILQNKTDNDRTKKLEESTQGISEQMAAIESLVQCKVDKSQFPLIQSCQKQLDSFEAFKEEITEKVYCIDHQMSETMNNTIDAKMDQTDFEHKMSEMKEAMHKKVDMAFLNEEVIKRLNALLPDLLVLLNEHKQISVTKCFDNIQTIEGTVKEMKQSLTNNKENLNEILKTLYNTPSSQAIDQKADLKMVEALNKESKVLCDSNCNKLKSNINQINGEIDRLKTVCNALEEKNKIALKFVDWYSNIHLE